MVNIALNVLSSRRQVIKLQVTCAFIYTNHQNISVLNLMTELYGLSVSTSAAVMMENRAPITAQQQLGNVHS